MLEEQAQNKRRNGFQPGNKIGPRFKSGESGNPGGRPKGESLTALLRRALSEEQVKGLSYSEIIINALIEAATARNIPAIKEILDRIDGPVVKQREVTINVDVTVKLKALVAWFSVFTAKMAEVTGISSSPAEIRSAILAAFDENEQRAIEPQLEELLNE